MKYSNRNISFCPKLDYYLHIKDSTYSFLKIYVDLINKNWKLDVKESIVIKEWLRRKEIKKKD